MEDGNTREVATLGGGCFWCLEAVFQDLRGVESVQSGYMGGHVPDPTYEQVCTGTTGHVEVVRVVFDPSAIGYRDLLEVFFAIHDPTTPDRQGNDVGPQYRSAVFHHTDAQRRAAEELVREMQARGDWSDPIVTEIVPAGTFYAAEAYHDDYYRRNRFQPYCQIVVAPKVAKLRKSFGDLVREGARD